MQRPKKLVTFIFLSSNRQQHHQSSLIFLSTERPRSVGGLNNDKNSFRLKNRNGHFRVELWACSIKLSKLQFTPRTIKLAQARSSQI
jgi:hypothetical protein